MAKVKSLYKYRGKTFRYDYENGLVSYLFKATDQEYKDNEDWRKSFGNDLWDIDEDGYIENQTVGLMRANWENREMRNSYLDMWIDEMEEEVAYLASEFANEFYVNA